LAAPRFVFIFGMYTSSLPYPDEPETSKYQNIKEPSPTGKSDSR